MAEAFFGAIFDGRYVYFAPNYSGNVVTRYDTLVPFASATSWGTFDPATLNASVKGFQGVAFDGQYVYFVPWLNGTFVRFEAKAAPALPALPQFHGSFF